MASSSQLFLSSESHTTEQRLVWLTYFIFCELRVWNGRRPAGGTTHSVTSCGVNKRGRVLKYGLVQANRDIVQNEPVYCVFWHLVQKSLKTEILFKTHSKQTNSGFCVLASIRSSKLFQFTGSFKTSMEVYKIFSLVFLEERFLLSFTEQKKKRISWQ